MLKMGIAGFRHGHIYTLCDAVRESSRVELVGAWEEDEATVKDAENNHGITFTHKTYEEMLSDKSIDVIGIGNYYGARGKMVIDALKAGKSVIADKPVCTSMEELSKIERLSKEKGLAVGMMLNLRDNENVLAAKKLIADGELGEIHNVQFGGQHPLMYGQRAGWYFEKGKHGGLFNDIAIHGIDLLTYMTGLEIKDILAARSWNAYATKEPDFKDAGQLMLTLENGAGVIADVSYSIPNSIGFNLPYYWSFKIWGSRGMISFTASSNGVELYQDGLTEVRVVKGIPCECDYLDSFLDEVEGRAKRDLSTERVIKSSRATLLVEEKANRL